MTMLVSSKAPLDWETVSPKFRFVCIEAQPLALPPQAATLRQSSHWLGSLRGMSAGGAAVPEASQSSPGARAHSLVERDL